MGKGSVGRIGQRSEQQFDYADYGITDFKNFLLPGRLR